MKKLVLFFFLMAFVFMGSFFLAQFDFKRGKGRAKEENFAFSPASFALKHRPFTIVIVGRNNGASVAKTLESVFSQSYENFRLVYIDDASDDGSYEVARDAIYEAECLTRVTLVQNEEKLGTLANIYRAVQALPDEEIVVVLDGKDRLAHEWVLQRLNAYYENPSLWIALAQGIYYPSFQKVPAQDLKEGRELKRVEEHLKTFYAALFKKVRESDFVYAGTYLQSQADLAYILPMIEMGKEHTHFIPEVLSLVNEKTAEVEDRELALRSEKFIRSLDPYPALTTLRVPACGE